jgi:hypothetical protein
MTRSCRECRQTPPRRPRRRHHPARITRRWCSRSRICRPSCANSGRRQPPRRLPRRARRGRVEVVVRQRRRWRQPRWPRSGLLPRPFPKPNGCWCPPSLQNPFFSASPAGMIGAISAALGALSRLCLLSWRLGAHLRAVPLVIVNLVCGCAAGKRPAGRRRCERGARDCALTAPAPAAGRRPSRHTQDLITGAHTCAAGEGDKPRGL